MARGPRPTNDRLRRLLVMLPWLMERGTATVKETAERFGVSQANLIADLEKASLCGLPPYVDEMIDLYIDDGVIHMGVPRLFTRPLRLNPREGFALLAAGKAAVELPGADPAGPLARALAKLEATLGSPAVVTMAVENTRNLAEVRHAVEHRRQLAITYYSPWRDERTERVIDPQAVALDHGDWYVVADCHLAAAERRFRVDRIEALGETGHTFLRRDVDVTSGIWFADRPTTAVVLKLKPAADWVAERHPIESVKLLADGTRQVELLVSNQRFLERLLVRLGDDAEVLDPPQWRDLRATVSARLLRRYD